jgi:alpha-L-fucosidase
MRFSRTFTMIAMGAFVSMGMLPLHAQKVEPPAPVGPVPSAAQLAWHQMETNAFVHFTINTFTDREWGVGSESPKLFNPAGTDAMQWARVLKETGFKQMILTCKHHDGFCLWPTKYTEHSIKNSPYKNGKGDIVKEASDACKKYGLKFGVYLSPWDRNRADYGNPEYITYYRNQLKELFTSYGPVCEMWFDGANGGDGYYGGANEKRKIDGRTYYDWPATLDMVRQMQPNVIFFSDAGPGVRWVGNENGIAGETNWNTISPDTIYAGKAGIEKLLNEGSADGSAWIPAEVDVSIRPGWFYHKKEDSLVKSSEQLFDIYLTSVGRGSVLLLNVPPDQRGLFHEKDIKSLYGFRSILNREFAKNKAQGSSATASNYRGKTGTYSPGNAVDNNNDTYWATDDSVTTASLEINTGKVQTIKYVMLQEYIKLGQRVKSFTVDVWINDAWQQVAAGTTIGYKRILKLAPVKAGKVRINITASKACPVISNVAIY